MGRRCRPSRRVSCCTTPYVCTLWAPILRQARGHHWGHGVRSIQRTLHGGCGCGSWIGNGRAVRAHERRYRVGGHYSVAAPQQQDKQHHHRQHQRCGRRAVGIAVTSRNACFQRRAKQGLPGRGCQIAACCPLQIDALGTASQPNPHAPKGRCLSFFLFSFLSYCRLLVSAKSACQGHSPTATEQAVIMMISVVLLMPPLGGALGRAGIGG